MAGDDRDNVIHVDFASGGRRAPAVEAGVEAAAGARKRPASRSVAPAEDAERREDPLAALYTCGEVARLFGLTASRLRYWDKSGFIQPSGQAGARRFYTFQDLISIRAAKGLLDRGVQLRRVRRSVEALRVSLPRVIRPLAELRVVADGQTVVVRGDEGTYEPATGQLVLDFEVRTLRDDVVRVLRRGARSDADRRAAYEHYLEGYRLDEEETTFDRAEQSYRRAIELDPSLANAVTNLGNLRFRRGFPDEAEKLYRQALEIDATQPEAHYNLGFLCYERGDAESAIVWFRRALDHDPSFADAHFNLAMALEELTRVREAKPHWETYLRLDPSGPWAEIARRHIE